MEITKHKLHYLEDFINEQGLSKNDVCIVGSFALELAGLREAGDIDIVIKESIRLAKGFDFNSAIKVNEMVEVVRFGWASFDDLTDDQLILDSEHSSVFDGFRVANLGLLRKKKKLLGRSKDLADLALLGEGSGVGVASLSSLLSVLRNLRRRGRMLVGRKLTWVKSIIRRLKCGDTYMLLAMRQYELAISPRNLISSEYIDGAFARYDTVVRLLAIEAYYGKNEFGFELYNQMQAARGAPVGYEERFRSLIQSVEESSFDWKSVFEITPEGYLWDGSHRLALALYHDVPVVSARIQWRQTGTVSYGLDWFKRVLFSAEECALLLARKEQLFWERGLYFSLVLWPPVADFFNEIESEIEHRVVKSTDYVYSGVDFESVVRTAYAMDDIAEWKVCKKLSHMAPYEKKIRVLWLEFACPEYRKKDLNNSDISQVGERLKADIRGKYKNEVSNYIYDIICHTGDNWDHNKKMMEIFDIK